MTREKFTRRHYLPEDYPALAQLVNAANFALGVEHSISAEELATYIEAENFNPCTDSFIFEDGGRIVAMSNQGFSAASGLCWADGVVHPQYWGQGIGAELLRLTEARCLEWAQTALTPEQPLSIRLATGGSNARAQRLFAVHGYQPVRTYHQMRIELDQPVDAPPLPLGLALHPFELERDAYAVYEADMDAFADHYDFQRDSYEEWTRQMLDHPYNDTSLWLVAYDGDEIAGICLNRAYGSDQPHMAWISLLGVRRAWRRQGVGEALLRLSFAQFQERGYSGAGLFVDSSNQTNAVGLYERAGMHVHSQRLIYRKGMRGEANEMSESKE